MAQTLAVAAATLDLLASGAIRLEGQFVWGSNTTFLARLRRGAVELLAVYKPQRGERPLWDFPGGTLAAREAAAWHVSDALGWELVPPTVLRRDGPFGPGSLQLFLALDPQRHYFTFGDEEKERLRPVVVFDILVNNADRKAGHVLLGEDGHLWLIDHGVCFHVEPKLRTVIWDFAGQPIPARLLDDVDRFGRDLEGAGPLRSALTDLLAMEEVDALRRRATEIVETGRFPLPGPGRPYPWPLV